MRAFVWGLAACVPMLVAGQLLAAEVLDRDAIVARLAASEGGAARQPRTRGIAVEATVPGGNAYVVTALPAIEFEHDSARLTSRAVRQLDELSAALRTPPLDGFRFSIEGHTNSIGTASYNRGLSLRRADEVTRFLADAGGVRLARLVPVGRGESLPLRGTRGDEPQNRRVEVARLGGAGAGQEYAVTPGGAASPGRALLVGVDRYQHLSRLGGAPVNDVEAVRAFLTSAGGFDDADVRTLVDAQATRSNILQAIDGWLVAADGPALFYFSGHGHQQPDTDGDEADGLDETLIPVDTTVADGVAQDMIADDEIGGLLARMAGRQVTVVVDACHSGTLSRSASDASFVKSPRLPSGAPLARPSATRGIQVAADHGRFVEGGMHGQLTVWSAVRADQKALVDAHSGPDYLSVFTSRLLDGARDGKADADGNGTVSVEELQNHLRRESDAYCASMPADCPKGLTPQLQAASVALARPAFGANPAGATRSVTSRAGLASLAKDILVSPTAAGGGAGNVGVEIAAGTDLRVGDEIEVTVHSERAGELVLLDFNADGQLVQLFPNDHSIAGGMSPTLAAGSPVRLPGRNAGFRLRAQPPTGRGLLIALVGDNLEPLASRHKDLAVVATPDAFVVELAGHLRRWSERGWGYGELSYRIAE